MKDFSIRKIVISSLSILLAVVCLLSLFADLIYIPSMSYLIGKDIEFEENGFELLQFHSALSLFRDDTYSWAVIIIGICSWVQLIASSIFLLLIIISLFLFSRTVNNKLCTIFNVLSFVFCIIYTAEGIMMMNLFNFYYYDRIGYIATTRAFIPFIFEIFIFIAYFICNTVLVEKDGRIESLELNIEKKNKRINQSENMRIELLEKYKELMDKGIITQEEFFEKKKQLLR